MRHLLIALLGLLVSSAACSKDEGQKSTKETKQTETVGADGVRRISIEAGKAGYDPETITAKPGEKLILVFTRTVEGECLSQVKVGDGPVTDLPMNQPVEIAVTAPESGKLEFACGMDMQTGVIAVN